MYKFTHISDSSVPDIVKDAFDTRYTANRTMCFTCMNNKFTQEYINKYKSYVRIHFIPEYYPEFSRIKWIKENNAYVSQVEVMKTKQKLSIGFDIRERWTVDGNNIITNVVQCNMI